MLDKQPDYVAIDALADWLLKRADEAARWRTENPGLPVSPLAEAMALREVAMLLTAIR